MLDIAKNPTRPIALDLQDLHKSYGSLAVLKGVSLTAYDGDVISILGSSGSGKSTLLRCINLLEKPNQGRIIIGNDELILKPTKSGELQAADIKQLESLRARVGFVFQTREFTLRNLCCSVRIVTQFSFPQGTLACLGVRALPTRAVFSGNLLL